MRNVLVTGSASGIGNYIANQYIKSGYNVICIDREPTEINGQYTAYKCDLFNEDDCKNIFNKIDKIDFAINCAGISCKRKLLIEFSNNEILQDWSLNFLATFNALKNEILIMQKYGGKIVNIASIIGSIGTKNRLVYGASKAAIINMTKVAAIEYAKDKILINSISPASIDTPMLRQKYNGKLRDYTKTYYTDGCGTVHDVYTIVCMLEQNNFMTGNDIILDGGMTSLFSI